MNQMGRLEEEVQDGIIMRILTGIKNYLPKRKQEKEQTSTLTPYDHIVLSRLHKNYLRRKNGLSQNHIHSRETTVPE